MSIKADLDQLSQAFTAALDGANPTYARVYALGLRAGARVVLEANIEMSKRAHCDCPPAFLGEGHRPNCAVTLNEQVLAELKGGS